MSRLEKYEDWTGLKYQIWQQYQPVGGRNVNTWTNGNTLMRWNKKK